MLSDTARLSSVRVIIKRDRWAEYMGLGLFRANSTSISIHDEQGIKAVMAMSFISYRCGPISCRVNVIIGNEFSASSQLV